jgi:hypothetical protein
MLDAATDSPAITFHSAVGENRMPLTRDASRSNAVFGGGSVGGESPVP